jgi:hypothetical protein
LHRRQASEETPRQPRMIAENDAVSFGNHLSFIDP